MNKNRIGVITWRPLLTDDDIINRAVQENKRKAIKETIQLTRNDKKLQALRSKIALAELQIKQRLHEIKAQTFKKHGIKIEDSI